MIIIHILISIVIVMLIVIACRKKVENFFDDDNKWGRLQDTSEIYKNNLHIYQKMLHEIEEEPVQIPLHIYQTYKNVPLTGVIAEAHELLKKQNPEFTFHLYDDDMCREFIKQNYDDDVLYAYDNLIPGAYKADLWRYCILYKNGGIYADIKFVLSPNAKIKLIDLTDKEYYVRDVFVPDNGRKMTKYEGEYIYQALLISSPGNEIYLKCIEEIVRQVKEKDISQGLLGITGPALFGRIMHENMKYMIENINFNVKSLRNVITELKFGASKINYENDEFIIKYKSDEYYDTLQKDNKHYSEIWPNIFQE